MPDTDTPASPAIRLNMVCAESAGYTVFRDVSAAFPVGRISVVLGATGSGKSALLKLAAGLMVPSSGSVEYLGKDMNRFTRKDEADFRSRSGFVFQDAALWADTTILNNVVMPLRVHKPWMSQSEIAEAARLSLKRIGYDEGMAFRPADLSAGEQKMVSIARAIVHDPDLIFMDDPGSNLDEDGLERLYTLLGELGDAGKTVIVAANSSEFAYRFADMLGVIKNETIVAFGGYDETLSRASAELEGSLARLKARGGRTRKLRGGEPPAGDPGSEMSQRGDV